MIDVRNMIREALKEYITLGKEDIERALEELDISGTVDDAIKEQLPYAIVDIVREEADEAVADYLADALS